jgi:hypothetical protein
MYVSRRMIANPGNKDKITSPYLSHSIIIDTLCHDKHQRPSKERFVKSSKKLWPLGYGATPGLPLSSAGQLLKELPFHDN